MKTSSGSQQRTKRGRLLADGDTTCVRTHKKPPGAVALGDREHPHGARRRAYFRAFTSKTLIGIEENTLSPVASMMTWPSRP